MFLEKFLGRRQQGQNPFVDAPQTTAADSLAKHAPNADEILIESVNEFRNRMRHVAAKAKSEHTTLLSDAQKRIQYSESFVKKTGIHQSLLVLLKELWHWPSWSKRDDFENHKNFDAENVQGEEIENDKVTIKRVDFSYGGENYRFEFEEDKSYFEGSKWGTVRIFQNDKLVISARVYHNLERHNEYYEWDYLNVDNLEVGGSWVGHIVEIEEKIKMAREKFFMDLEAKRVLEQAKHLPGKE